MRSIHSFLLISLSLLVGSCSSPPKAVTLSEAHQTFLNIVNKELGHEVVLTPVGKTLWIYIPIQDNIVDVESSRQGPKTPIGAKEKFNVLYLEGEFADQSFHIDYDIVLSRNYGKDLGYTSIYTDEYQKIQGNILSGIQRSYFDVEDTIETIEVEDLLTGNVTKESVAGSSSEEHQPPDFIVMVIADINKGIEIESMLYYKDFKKAMSMPPAISQEEYAKRYITDLRGNSSIKNDWTGKHLKYRDLTLEEFLSKQILNRINFKYQRSAFLPSENTADEILKEAASTVRAYNFREFNSVKLKDMHNGSTMTVSREDIEERTDIDDPNKGGRLIHIKFQ